MTDLTKANDLSKIVPIIDKQWDADSKKMCEDREWLTQQASNRIKEMCKKNMEKTYRDEGKLLDEIEFYWYNVRSDLMKYCGVMINGTYCNDNTPMNYSFDTIFNGGFTSQKTKKINRQRLRDAGVINPFVLDVKRAMADSCVKIWDVSDKEKSKINVWKITIFVHEIRKRNEEIIF